MTDPTPARSKEDDVNAATVEARRAFDLILQSERDRKEGWDAREKAILALAATGMSHRTISETLHRQATEAGLGEEDIDALGISLSNVRHVLRERRQVEEALLRQTRTEQ